MRHAVSERELVMICPKCNAQMETVRFLRVEIDRCTSCQGLWFDALEKEKLAEMPHSESIDTGDAATGKFTNTIEPTECPRCKGKLVKMVDPQQPHIWFESCHTCGGAFFDAGEFTDYKQHDWLDRFRDLFTGERKTEEEPPSPDS